MKVVTYLGFTLLSILIQFSVMDFIQSIMQLGKKPNDASIATSQKRQLRDVLKDLNYKPHALYYRTQINKLGKDNVPAKIYDNSSLPDLLTTTEPATGIFEIFYDDSTSATEEDNTSFTTEAIYSTTEFDNVTEISFFGETNRTTSKPNVKPKKKNNRGCKCNILCGVCDINCCCDLDCSEIEIEMFSNCTKSNKSLHYDDVCYSHLFHFSQDGPITSILNDWFCIVKINLPERPTENKNIYPLTNNYFFTWKEIIKPQLDHGFANRIYKYGDPLWLIKNESIYYIDLPSPVMNSYCTGRKTIQFLENHKFSCYVKIADLEMLQVIQSSEETSVISATPFSMNSTYLNCTSLHCINWSLIICKTLTCENYNKTVHEPACTESICTNLALKLEYIFNYHDSKITNATIKFHVQDVPINLNYMQQEIEVKFVLTNESIEHVLKLSGNPGYIYSLPVIVSYAEINYTDAFYNKSSQLKAHMALPDSKGGICVASILADNLVLFGSNRRLKCRYYHKYVKLLNGTEECKLIQRNIDRLLKLKNKLAVSPLGDPENLEDRDWIPLVLNVSDNAYLYGELHEKSSKLYCYNIITRYSFVLSYAEIDGANRILGINFDTLSKNASYSLDDISAVVTIDINFVDVSKPSSEFQDGPNLSFSLPNDFFLPFPSNESQVVRISVFCLILYCCVAIVASK